jgi:hypothetical protein
MHHFIFPTSDAWISSGSSNIDGTSFKDQNFGRDPILEVKKEFYNSSFDYQTRAIINFTGTDFTSLSSSISSGDITSPIFYLRLYEAEGNSDLSTTYKLLAQPISQSWDEGRGKFGDDPKVTNGVSWENRNYPDGGTAVTWSNVDGTPSYGGAVHSISSSVQSFSYESPDVEMDITSMVNTWLTSSYDDGGIDNYGLLLRFSGSQETDSTTFGQLKFFSKDTHTIYAPKLEVRWDDSSFSTGSLISLDVTGSTDNYLYMKNLQESYKESDKVKFRVGARKQYIQKNFSTSVQTLTGSFIPENSGSYSIVDMATGETVIPFSDYTKLSCDSTSNYFIQWLNGFYPNRAYKILFKLKYDDSQEQIFDNDFEFIVRK